MLDEAQRETEELLNESLERLATGYKGKSIPEDENEPPQGTEGE